MFTYEKNADFLLCNIVKVTVGTEKFIDNTFLAFADFQSTQLSASLVDAWMSS